MKGKRSSIFAANLREKWMPWAVGAAAVFTASLASSAIYDLVHSFYVEHYGIEWVSIILLIIYGIIIFSLYQIGKQFIKPRTRSLRSYEPGKKEHLIMFLSHLRTNSQEPPVPLTGNLDNDIKALEDDKKANKRYWQWEMPLRAIRYHIGQLKTVTIVCSKESIEQTPLFCNIFGKYYESNLLKGVELFFYVKEKGNPVRKQWNTFCPAVPTGLEGWDFEDFDELSDDMSRLIRMFIDEGTPEDKIIIDFTGGQKVTSVIAVAITFNRNIEAQYVQTNDPWAVKSYDIIYKAPDSYGI